MVRSEYSDIDPTPIKAGPKLAIQLNGSGTFIPGDTLTGQVIRQEHVVAPQGTVTIKLVGRTGVKHTEEHEHNNANGGSSKTTYYHRSKFILFETSQMVFNGPVHIPPQAQQPQTWPFAITIPTTASPHTLLAMAGPKRLDRSFLPLDEASIVQRPLPFSYSFRGGFLSDQIVAYVEYFLEASFVEQHVARSNKPKVKLATLPLQIKPPPVPPLGDFQMCRHVITGGMVRTQRLLPGRGEGSDLTKREHLAKFFRSSSVPKFAFSLEMELPSALQIGNIIPLKVRVVPDRAETTDIIAKSDQTVHLVAVRLRFTARAQVLFDYEDSKYKEGLEKDCKDHFELQVLSDKVIIPTVGAVAASQDGTSQDGKSQDGKSQDGKFQYGGGQTQAPAPEFLDVGQVMKLRLGHDHVQFLDNQTAKLDMGIYPDFATYNIAHRHLLKCEITVSIAGEKVKLATERAVVVLPGWV
ncbi:hypothetical protein B0H66DRAFT_169675 [Apodospora peruviana]|uniref:Arrestin-like N-terminal domain-containing protein n=1 Tax=Apodospora peruviana TaxID=516989 RepID=A0AAE0MBY4_9PEZI|nr:hypothetical protein B0H66DRAFT_169675 [Apodospora peruviana]